MSLPSRRPATGELESSSRLPVVVRESPGKGRGAFANRPIAAGELLERAPVLVLSFDDLELLNRTALDDYLVYWPLDSDEHQEAMALGLVAVANHSSAPNTRILRLVPERVVEWRALRDIEEGEELTFAYRCGAWFEEK